MIMRLIALGVAMLAHVSAFATPRPTDSNDIVLVTDPAALAVVAESDGSFGALVGGRDFAGASNHVLDRKTRYGTIVAVLARDLRELARADPKLGVGVRGNPHRLFNARWLSADTARFELIGVVNRIDRMPFTSPACGETRLIYRLAYTDDVKGELVHSRLPMTIAVALGDKSVDPQKSCRQAALRWQAPANLAGSELGRWLMRASGPLHAVLTPVSVTRVEINMQSVRWPSTVRPDLGGHAEYLLRVFQPGADMNAAFFEAPLLSTPDVAGIRANPRARAQLIAWIGQNLNAIDDGSAMLPDALSARRAISVTPRGLSRRANRPYRQLLTAVDLKNINFATLRYARSPAALLRRLDDLTCQGCHQARTIAGFHLLGIDQADVGVGNALAVATSPHLFAEVQRRAALNRNLAAGNRPDFARPFAERRSNDSGGYGAHCGLGDPGFAAWTCVAGLRCEPYDASVDDAVVGVCLPQKAEVGDPCQIGTMTAHADPHRDAVTAVQSRPCSGTAVCNTNNVGFPGGMCTESCGASSAQSRCGVIAQLQPFNECLARKTPFPRCLAAHVSPAGLRACDAATPCRDDYICARTPTGEAVCIPPYFLFQLRVDGHP
ncbi:MAG: hypothetical protein HY308_03370 [Gammaproteobacteria bacterium]|nr:hypothetical protein [Gammaproteobacteria bacterium]